MSFLWASSENRMAQSFFIKILSWLNFLANCFGYSIFKYPEKSFKFSLFGIVGLIINASYGTSRFYAAICTITEIISTDITKNTKTFFILIILQLLLINFSNLIVMIANVFCSKAIFKTFNEIEKLEHEVFYWRLIIINF